MGGNLLRGTQMRGSLPALIAITVIAALQTLPAAAREFPFCLKGCDFGGARGDCSFVSYQQCQAAASGRDATCAANPYFNARAELRPNGGRQRARRF
jgi:hypothetical protein